MRVDELLIAALGPVVGAIAAGVVLTLAALVVMVVLSLMWVDDG